MILYIDNTDVTNALMQRPNITLENQKNNRFSIVTSISQLRLKKGLLPSAIYDKILNRELITSEILNDGGQKIFSGYINGNGVVYNTKEDELLLDTLSLLYLPKEIDFVFQETASVREFVDEIKTYLIANSLWKPGSIESLYAPQNLRWHANVARLKAVPVVGFGIDKIELGSLTIDGGASRNGAALMDSNGVIQAYIYFEETDYTFTPLGATVVFDNNWVSMAIPDQGTQAQVIVGFGGNQAGVYYIDVLPTESIDDKTILYCLAPIYWQAEQPTWNDVVYDFNYDGKLSDAILDMAILTDSKIYYDENGIGYIVFQAYATGGSTIIDPDYILNESLRFIEEDLSNSINFKGVDVPEDILNQYIEYYKQRAFYEKRFSTTEVEVYPYSGIDNIKIFTPITGYGDVLKIQKDLEKYRYKILMK